MSRLSFSHRDGSIITILLFLVQLLILIPPLFGQESDKKVSGLECSVCHSEKGWKPLAKNMTFNHSKTAFRLEGRHQNVRCIECHTGKTYKEIHDFQAVDPECRKCHTDIHKSQLGTHCKSCHTATSWTVARSTFDHDETQFPLVGVHKAVECQGCHDLSDPISLANVSLECFGCHKSDYDNAKDPDHLVGGFPTSCKECHNVNDASWSNAEFRHDQFVLASDCYSCHQADYEGTAGEEVDHVAQQFPTICEECHTTSDWDEAEFDHSQSDFPLNGAHVNASCLDCHASGVYDGLATACESCHLENYNNTSDPSHGPAGFVAGDCQVCHTETGWVPSSWDHNTETSFTLDGSHLSASCLSCHVDDLFVLDSDCYSCHQADYERELIHLEQGLGTNCLECHNTIDWADVEFDHDGPFFPIYSGKHAGKWGNDCSTCHLNPADRSVFTCITGGCHDEAADLQHKHLEGGATGYVYESEPCYACHPTGEDDNTFDHATTGFSLEGQHAQITCDGCHIDYDFQTDLNSECIVCHETDYSNASNPDHATAGFGQECMLCHDYVTFEQSSWDHQHETGFALKNGHSGHTCNTCHEGDEEIGYDQTNVPCSACHTDNYDATTNPVHGDAGFGQICDECHTTITFETSTWDHAAATGFVLVGDHAQQTCNDCHTLNEAIGYNPSNVTCSSCHLDNYNVTTDPDHSAAQFPKTCENCHTSFETWEGASFEHNTYYELSEDHRDLRCAQCHVGSNYEPSCWDCHNDDFYDEHESGNNTNCWECHSTFDWEDEDDDDKNKSPDQKRKFR